MDNPYEPPPEVESDGGVVDSQRVLLQSIDFVSDWSQAGQRQRRRRSCYLWIDIAFLALSLVSAAAVLLLMLDVLFGVSFEFARTESICCVLPLWIGIAVLMLMLWAHRSATTLTSTANGFAGQVIGRIEGPWISLFGPQVLVFAHSKSCNLLTIELQRIILQVTGCAESFYVSLTDIRRREQRPVEWRDLLSPIQALTRQRIPQVSLAAAQHWIEIAKQTIQQDASLERTRGTMIDCAGTLCGRHLRGTWHQRLSHLSGASFTLAGLAIGGWAYQTYRSLPSWVLTRPSHYVLAQSETETLTMMYFAIIVSVLLFLIGLWQWWQVGRVVGSYAASVSQDLVLIATDKVCYGYRGEALAHFQWTPQGLAAVAQRGTNPVFLLPSDWFDPAEQLQVSQWFPQAVKGVGRKKPSSYIYPRI